MSRAVTPLRPGPLAVERHLDGRVVERLLDLDVAERLDPVELLAELVHEGAGVGQVPPADDDLDRRGRAQAHRLGDQVARLEREDQVARARWSACSGVEPEPQELLAIPRAHLLGQDLAQPLLKLEDIDSAPFAEADAEQAVVGPAAPEIGHVDRELRRVAAGVAHRDVDVVGPDLLGDHVERLLGDLAWSARSGSPAAGRTRSWNWPVSTLGNSSRPSWPPTTTTTAPVASRYASTTLRRCATVQSTTRFKSVLHPHEEPRPRSARRRRGRASRAGSPAARRSGPARTCSRAGTT